MNRNSLYAFYGSLRRGMNNYELHRDGMKYLYSVRLKGFKLYSRGQYPCVAKSNDESAVEAEVFHIIDAKIEKQIHDLEMSEGYFYDEVTIDNMQVGIYLYASVENFVEVKEGDWVTFFRQRA
jgi:gamma-glutamylcyclotransferase (GGCT)/AIG2-like uncharacterized protein YtfP